MKSSVLDKIEELRQQMYITTEGKKLTDPEIVELSEELDKLLNKYMITSGYPISAV